jgi:hypothetical protein
MDFTVAFGMHLKGAYHTISSASLKRLSMKETAVYHDMRCTRSTSAACMLYVGSRLLLPILSNKEVQIKTIAC